MNKIRPKNIWVLGLAINREACACDSGACLSKLPNFPESWFTSNGVQGEFAVSTYGSCSLMSRVVGVEMTNEAVELLTFNGIKVSLSNLTMSFLKWIMSARCGLILL